MRHLVIIVFTLALFASPILAAQDEETRRYTEIEGLIEDQLYEEAIARIEEFLRDFPTSPTAEVVLFQQAELQFKAERFADAVLSLERFLREHGSSPKLDQARFLLASAYRLVDRFAEARAELTVLLRRRRLERRLRVAALDRRAAIALQLGRPEEALRDLEELARLAETPQRSLRLANAYYELGKFKQAERLFRRLVKEPSLSGEEQRTVTLRLALVLHQRKRYRDVVELLQPLQSRYSDDEAVIMALAWALYRMERFEEAYAVVSARPRSAGSELAALIREGRSLLMVHEYEASIQFFERLLEGAESAPALEPAYRALSRAYFALGDLTGGIEALERLAPMLADDEERFELWVEIGDLYEASLENRAGAVAAYRKALAVDPRGPRSEEIAVKVLRSQVELGALAEAGETAVRFLDDFPESRYLDEVLFLSGRIYEKAGDHARALEQYRNIAQSRGSSPLRGRAYEAGLSLVSSLRRWEEVIAIGREYLQEFPDAGKDSQLHLSMARAYYQTGQFREGIRHYERALTAESGEVRISRVLLQIGWGYYKLGDFERAASSYSRVEENYADEPELEDALYWLGWLAQADSDLPRANTFFGRMLRRFPGSRYAEISLWQVANNHLRLGENREAISTLNDIVDRFPGGEYAELARGKLVQSYVDVGNYRAALERMKVFTESDPSLEATPADLLAKGDGLARAGNRSAALEAFRRLLERFPASEVADDATLNIGILQYQAGNNAEAVIELRKVEQFFPGSEKVAAADFYLGQSLMRLRRYEDAVERFRAALEKRAERKGAEIIHYLIGVCFEQLGDKEAAVGAYRNYLARAAGPSGEPDRRLRIALLFAATGDLDEAKTQLEGIIEAAQDVDLIVRAQFALGAAFEKQGRLAEAAMEYLKVTYVHSSSPLAALSARFQAGQLFERLGRLQEAINVYEKIAENHGGTRFGEVAAIRIQTLRKRLEEGVEGEDGTKDEDKP